MSLDRFISLDPAEHIPDRPFSDPEHSWRDLATLEYMCRRLHQVVQAHAGLVAGSHIHLREPDGRPHRIIVTDRTTLLDAQALAVVGFCGQKRTTLDPSLVQEMEEVDDALIGELAGQPYLLSYSSMQLADGNWANLVMMRSVEGIEHWRTSPRHAAAVSDLSPHYYRSIRLHNALLTGGLASPHLILLRTKYYDYRDGQCWMAVRAFPLSPDSHPNLLR